MSKIKCEDRIKMVLCELMCFYESFVILSSFRISNLQRELEKSRLKEADETRAMEDVARMVEQNLEKTTVDFYLCCFYLYYLFVQFLIRTVQVLFFCSRHFVQTIWVSSAIATLRWIATFEVHSKYDTDPSNLPPRYRIYGRKIYLPSVAIYKYNSLLRNLLF